MSLFREIPPTAGLAIYPKDIFSAFFAKNQNGSLEEDLKSYLGAPYAAVTYSGTAAFYIILESLKKLSAKKTVIIPSFICPLVPLAIKRAGLKVLVCDINKDDFNFEINRLEELCSGNNDVLAIVATHLAGIPLELETIQNVTEKHGIFIIEDCAQSLGASYRGRKTGTFGDFAFFSLCRGKGLTIYEGGVIVSKPQFAALIESELNKIAKTDLLSESLKILELFGYWIFYRPLLFWFVFKAPQIFWLTQGKIEKAFIESFDTNFPVHKVSGIRKRFAHAMFKRLENGISEQRQIAAEYIAGLNKTPGLKLITESDGDCSNYPYLTLLFDETSKRDEIFKELNNCGLGVSIIYLSAITDYLYLKDITAGDNCPNAQDIARNHITLTTNAYLTPKDIRSLIERIKDYK